MSDSTLVNNLNEVMQLSIPPQSRGEELIQILSDYINQLIDSDFQQLVNLLYRLDVSEEKLKECLAKGPAQDTSLLIAKMIIERQEQKIKSRQQFSKRDQSVDEEESW
jgi:hypothetical protein